METKNEKQDKTNKAVKQGSFSHGVNMETKKTKKNITKKVSTKAVFSHEADIYSAQGKKTGSIKLPENVFGVAWSDALIHQVVTAMQANARPTVAHAKTRGEVSGGGRKPWAQKGTGRARHGSSRSPIWKGGGVTHGPRSDRVYKQKVNKKVKKLALQQVLSEKARANLILVIDSFSMEKPKTRVMEQLLQKLPLGSARTL